MIREVLLTACFFLAFTHTFAFKRFGQLHRLEQPLWYGQNGIPTFCVIGIALLFWPVLISAFVWGAIHYSLRRVGLECLGAAILAGIVEPLFPPMLAVLLAGTPSTVIAIILWFL